VRCVGSCTSPNKIAISSPVLRAAVRNKGSSWSAATPAAVMDRRGRVPDCNRRKLDRVSERGATPDTHGVFSLRLMANETGIISPATCELDRYYIKCASVVSAACT
jgi:hypothetical protein